MVLNAAHLTEQQPPDDITAFMITYSSSLCFKQTALCVGNPFIPTVQQLLPLQQLSEALNVWRFAAQHEVCLKKTESVSGQFHTDFTPIRLSGSGDQTFSQINTFTDPVPESSRGIHYETSSTYLGFLCVSWIKKT